MLEKLVTRIYRLVHLLEDRTRQRRLARAIRSFADLLDLIDYRGIKYTLMHIIWETLRNLDKGKGYEGETAPYCGHHYSGFDNKYISTSYHEGDGGGATKFSVFGYKLYYENVEADKFYIAK